MKRRIAFTIALLQAAALPAAVIDVPAVQPTIGAGVAAAADGDTVLVAPGRYYENVSFRSARIVLASRYLLTGDPSDIDATIIDGSAPAHPDTASCVLITSADPADSSDTSSSLVGFTLTGGRGTVWADPHVPGTSNNEGGALLVQSRSPRIIANRFIANAAYGKAGCFDGAGGAIKVGDGCPQIIGNCFIGNRSSDHAGAVLLWWAGAIIRNNLFAGNRTGGAWGGGAAICIDNSQSHPVLVENNTIAGNDPGQGSAAVVHSWSSTTAIKNTIIWGNRGISVLLDGGSLTAEYCDIEGGWDGTGNIAADPCLLGSELLLSPASPGVDAGDPGAGYDDPEDSVNAGQARWPSLGALRNDMGAYGGPSRPAFSPLPPFLTGTHPLDRAIKVPIADTIRLAFPVRMDTGSFSWQFSDPAKTFQLRWNPSGDSLDIIPLSPYGNLSGYSCVLLDVQDTTGRHLVPLPDTLRFTTTDTTRPRLTATVPADGAAGVALNAKLYLKFTRRVRRTSLQFEFSDTAVHFTTSWYNGDTLAVLSHAVPFAAATGYTATVTAVQDTFGNELAPGDVPNPFSFTTLASGVAGMPDHGSAPLRVGALRPNPAAGGQCARIEVTNTTREPVVVILYNAMGQAVGRRVDPPSPGRHAIPLPADRLSPGVYFVRIEAGPAAATRKLVIVR